VTLVEVDTLGVLADEIRVEVQRGREGLEQAVEAYFAIGHRLLAARRILLAKRDFGAWVEQQNFGLERTRVWELMTLAEHEDEARRMLCAHNIGTSKLARQLSAANGEGRDRRSIGAGLGHSNGDGETPLTFPTIVIDPPWRYDNVATRGAAEDHYPTMSLGELADLDIPGTNNAHVYLWVTNAFLADGFDLLAAWGYRYKTTLTWCKPQIGLGNYFRNNTEHVLFGVRGSLSTNANDIGTWFVADRGQHSAKPESFYDLVERSSPGPFLEMFARRRRFGWHTWGDEA
jgi:N6-adenosine-specific RNA methylase IME4